MNVERLLVYINPVVRYATISVLNYGYDFSWLELTLECGRVPVSKKDLFSLLETLKDTMESQ